MTFQQMKLGTSVMPHFHEILTGQSISCIILMTHGHLESQKIQSQLSKTTIFNN